MARQLFDATEGIFFPSFVLVPSTLGRDCVLPLNKESGQKIRGCQLCPQVIDKETAEWVRLWFSPHQNRTGEKNNFKIRINYFPDWAARIRIKTIQNFKFRICPNILDRVNIFSPTQRAEWGNVVSYFFSLLPSLF